MKVFYVRTSTVEQNTERQLNLKVYNILFIVFLASVFFSCNNEKKVKEIVNYDPNASIQNRRKVFTGTDSLELNPFEMYYELKLKDIFFCGMNSYIVFEKGKNDSILFYDFVNNFNIISKDFKGCNWVGDEISIKLKASNSEIIRTVNKKQIYKAIIAYYSDSEGVRDGEGRCLFSGYYIVDILPRGVTFPRQID